MTESAARPDRITAEILTPIVREALLEPGASISDFEHRLVKGNRSPPDRGVFRLCGHARVPGRGAEVPWSLYLKITRLRGTPTFADQWDPIHREALFYKNGHWRDMPGRISAPRCLAVLDFPGDAPWIFLEEVQGTGTEAWPLSRYGESIRHLGSFQGAFLAGHELPKEAWADCQAWMPRACEDDKKRKIAGLDRAAAHPLSSRAYGGGLGDRIRALMGEYDRILDVVRKLPATVIHGDFQRNNQIAHLRADGTEETVVIDWDYWGIAQMGIDTCTLIGTGSLFNHPLLAPVKELVELSHESYLEGLRDAGWKGEAVVARFAVVGLPFLLYALGPVPTLDRVLAEESRPKMEKSWGLPARDIVDRLVRSQEDLLGYADEIMGLLPEVDSAL